MDQRTFETKVKELAEKLKSNGVAISDAQAKQMASDIISTERRAIKKQTQAVKQEKQRIDVDTPDVPEQTAVPDEREQFQHDDPLVRRAVEQQQVNQKRGGTDESIDQDRPIGELMAEDEQEAPAAQPAQSQDSSSQQPAQDKPVSDTQPRVTLDNPVVEDGEQKQSLAQQEQPAQPGGGKVSLDNPVVTQKRPEGQQGAQPQKPVPDQPPAQQAPSAQEESSQQEAAQQAKEQQEQSEKESEKKVDLSEMFNFGKRK